MPLRICYPFPFLHKTRLTGIDELLWELLNPAVGKLMDEAWFYLQGVQIGHLKFKEIINGYLNIIMQRRYLYFEH